MTEYRLEVSSGREYFERYDNMDDLKNAVESQLRTFQDDDQEKVTIVVEEKRNSYV